MSWNHVSEFNFYESVNLIESRKKEESLMRKDILPKCFQGLKNSYLLRWIKSSDSIAFKNLTELKEGLLSKINIY